MRRTRAADAPRTGRFSLCGMLRFMHMQTFLFAALAFPIMLVLDLLWIGVVGNGFYRSQIGFIMRPDVFWPAALAFYVIYALALAFFVVGPAVEAKSLTTALLTGAFLGLAAYAAYDLTNWATLSDWPVAVTFVDLAWGTVVSAVSAGGAYLLATRVLNV